MKSAVSLNRESGLDTIGMPPSSDLPKALISQRDDTTGSEAWLAATIWKCLDALKLEQAIKDTKFCNHLMRNPPSPRQKKLVQLDARL